MTHWPWRLQTLQGQNLGAGKYDRIKQGTYACMFIGILYCVLYILIAQFGTRYLALLFMNADEAASVMSYTQQLSVAYAYATPLLCWASTCCACPFRAWATAGCL